MEEEKNYPTMSLTWPPNEIIEVMPTKSPDLTWQYQHPWSKPSLIIRYGRCHNLEHRSAHAPRAAKKRSYPCDTIHGFPKRNVQEIGKPPLYANRAIKNPKRPSRLPASVTEAPAVKGADASGLP